MSKKIIFANIVNQLMISNPDDVYAKCMNIVTPRKIWLANEGDLIITPEPIPETFKNYACDLINIDPSSIITISPKGKNTEYLCERLLESEDYETFNSYIKNNTDAKMLCFAPDKQTINFAKSANIPFYQYDEYPSSKLIEILYHINTKSGFREVVENLDLVIPAGITCFNIADLKENAIKHLKKHKKIIIKCDRSSNGFGHLTLTENELLDRKLDEYLKLHKKVTDKFVIEQYINFVALPSIEIEVTNAGYEVLYICDQRCPNDSYSGMVTSSKHINQNVTNKLYQIADTFGSYVYHLGFRGICDIDGCLDKDENIYITESNFRRTAGTFIDSLVKRLLGRKYFPEYTWLQDAKVSKKIISFEEGLNLLQKSKLLYDKETDSGVICYVDTLKHDNKWRYLIVGSNIQHVEAIEQEVVHLLEL